MSDARYRQLRDSLQADDLDGAVRLERDATRRGDALGRAVAAYVLQGAEGPLSWTDFLDRVAELSPEQADALRARFSMSDGVFVQASWLRAQDPRLLLCGELTLGAWWFHDPDPLTWHLKNIRTLILPRFSNVADLKPGFEALSRAELPGLSELRIVMPMDAERIQALADAAFLCRVEKLTLTLKSPASEAISAALDWPLGALKKLHINRLDDPACEVLIASSSEWLRRVQALRLELGPTADGARALFAATNLEGVERLGFGSHTPLPLDALLHGDGLPALRSVTAQGAEDVEGLLAFTERLASVVETGRRRALGEVVVTRLARDRDQRKHLRRALRDHHLEGRAWIAALSQLEGHTIQGLDPQLKASAEALFDALSDGHALVRAGAQAGWRNVGRRVRRRRGVITPERLVRVARCGDPESLTAVGRALFALSGEAYLEGLLGVFDVIPVASWRRLFGRFDSCDFAHELAPRVAPPLMDAVTRERLERLGEALLELERVAPVAWLILAALPPNAADALRRRVLVRCFEEASDGSEVKQAWRFVRPGERRWALEWCEASSAPHHRSWAQALRARERRSPDGMWAEAMALVGSMGLDELRLGLTMMVTLCERFPLAREHHARALAWMESTHRADPAPEVRTHLLTSRARLSWLDDRLPPMVWRELERAIYEGVELTGMLLGRDVVRSALRALAAYPHASDLPAALERVLAVSDFDKGSLNWSEVGDAMCRLAVETSVATTLLQGAARPPGRSDLSRFLRDLVQAEPPRRPLQMARRRLLVLLRFRVMSEAF